MKYKFSKTTVGVTLLMVIFTAGYFFGIRNGFSNGVSECKDAKFYEGLILSNDEYDLYRYVLSAESSMPLNLTRVMSFGRYSGGYMYPYKENKMRFDNGNWIAGKKLDFEGDLMPFKKSIWRNKEEKDLFMYEITKQREITENIYQPFTFDSEVSVNE